MGNGVQPIKGLLLRFSGLVVRLVQTTMAGESIDDEVISGLIVHLVQITMACRLLTGWLTSGLVTHLVCTTMAYHELC